MDRQSPPLDRLLEELAAMPGFLSGATLRFSGEAILAAPGGGFCFLEQVWHLADLEAEAYARRIARVLAEDAPVLEDFDGGRVARERSYRARSLEEGLARFAAARRRNLDAFARLTPAEWARPASQEGVGSLTLSDLPRMMAEHDASHRDEIRVLLGEPPIGSLGSRVA
jgi:hypothetical protein